MVNPESSSSAVPRAVPEGSVGVLLVGTELLSGKVEEKNLVHLARSCARIGYEVFRVVMVHDDVQVIAAAVADLRALCTVVVTSGGVGPTHDDVTVDAVALAFGVEVRSEPVLLQALSEAGVAPYAAERMARLPEGAQLLRSEQTSWPLVRMGQVFLFPGVPAAFVRKLPAFELSLPRLRPLQLVQLYFTVDEAELVQALDAAVAEFPDVRVGSYPVWDDAAYRTRITFEHRELHRAASASDFLLLRLSVSQRGSRVFVP